MSINRERPILPTLSRDAELREVRADRVAHPRSTLDQHGAGAMQNQNALLLDGLHLRKPHVGARDRCADRLGIGFIILLSRTASRMPSRT